MPATRAQRLLAAAALPADQSVLVHEFADGWSVRRLLVVSDLLYEGALMRNCLEWAEYPQHRCDGARLRAVGHTNERYFSLRDPDNLPHVTFVMSNWSGRRRGHARQMRSTLGRHNTTPKLTHLRRLYEWAAELPGERPVRHVWAGERLGTKLVAGAEPRLPERELVRPSRASRRPA